MPNNQQMAGEFDASRERRRRFLKYNGCPQGNPLRTGMQIYGYDIVRHGEWHGVCAPYGIEVVEPIYDSLLPVPGTNKYVAQIDNDYAVLDITNASSIEPLGTLDVAPVVNGNARTLTIKSADGCGLYSVERGCMVIPPQFAQTTVWAQARFLWVRLPDTKQYGYYDTHSGELIHCGEYTSRCYENSLGEMTAYDMRHGRVYAINTAGRIDAALLRRMVRNSGGHLQLYDATTNDWVYVNVYGQITN